MSAFENMEKVYDPSQSEQQTYEAWEAAGCFHAEPDPEKQPVLREFSDSVCVLPGLGFDLEGYRLGYGKGYYDRFLSKYPGTNLGVCYNVCLKPLLPHGRYDRMVDVLVTEKFVKRPRAAAPTHQAAHSEASGAQRRKTHGRR